MRRRLPRSVALPAAAALLLLSAAPANADPTYPTTPIPQPANPGQAPISAPIGPQPLGQAVGDAGTALGIIRLLPNAVPISHARTMENEVLGSSLGAPGTTVNLSATPVLPDSVELRVREDLSAEERTALDSEHGVTAGSSPKRAMPTVLSDLESRVLSLYLDGHSYTAVGEMLDCDAKTVDNALQRVKRTVGVHLAGRQVML